VLRLMKMWMHPLLTERAVPELFSTLLQGTRPSNAYLVRSPAWKGSTDSDADTRTVESLRFKFTCHVQLDSLRDRVPWCV
jgi:hypothetical protein